jgi:hypothetical protein
MALAARANQQAASAPGWALPLRWTLRGAGLLGCAAGLFATPELVRDVLHGGVELTQIGQEALLADRLLAVLAGGALLVVSERLPAFVGRPASALRWAGIGLPIALLLAWATLKIALGPEHTAYTGLVSEDSVVEYATALAYLAAGGVAALVARGLSRRRERLLGALWAGLSFALVVVSLEEISWGQRLFDVETPAPLHDNVQGEMNLHNLPPVQRLLHGAYVAVGLFGAFGWALLHDRGPARMRVLARWLLPPPMLLGCFLPVALVYLALDLTPARWLGPEGLRFGFVSLYDQEPAELLLSLGFLLFALRSLLRLRHW